MIMMMYSIMYSTKSHKVYQYILLLTPFFIYIYSVE